MKSAVYCFLSGHEAVVVSENFPLEPADESKDKKSVMWRGRQSRAELHTYLGEQGMVLFDMALLNGESKLLQGHCRNIQKYNIINKMV